MNQFDLPNHCANLSTQRYAITFGEVAILHVGGKEIGTKRDVGFTVNELRNISNLFPGYAELKILSDYLPPHLRQENEAAVLIIRNGVNLLLRDKYGKNKAFMEHQHNVLYDTKYWDAKKRKTLNKRARYNVVFGPHSVQPSQDFQQYTICGFDRVPVLNNLRLIMAQIFGPKAQNLNAEGNWYFEEKGGISCHGDAERKIVICISLGTSTTLRYYWRMAGSFKKYGEGIDTQINHGDIYIMSEKATGHDWRKSSKTRLVHAAGAKKYITHKK